MSGPNKSVKSPKEQAKNIHLVHAARRICLRCDRPFLSTGPGHRICNKCKGSHSKEIL